ncbi:MAG: NADH dehydrogenase [Desulfobulbaceae bacterium BRH_c16a]|nr:MAG: NADH dehydrogenase [Desulfobulbaceae bacterium BRH_c16a]
MCPKNSLQDLGIGQTDRRRIVIIGGGFAGLRLAGGLQKSNYQIVLLDRKNHHTFQHLLYQVATAELEAGAIAYPLRKVLKNHPDYHFRMVRVERIDPARNSVVTRYGDLRYDYLVIATGAETHFFGMDSVARHALPMKTIAEALDIKNRMLKNLEDALLTPDADERRTLATVVIAGGGPAGVETAGAFADFKRFVLPRDYPDLDPNLFKIYLIELLPRLLAQMSEEASESAETYLKNMGVEVFTETRIQNYDGHTVKTDKTEFPARLLLWTGGISGAFIDGLGEGLVDKKGRIAADRFCRVNGLENIYALGDVVHMATENHPEGHPQLAAVAVQQGEYLAGHFLDIEKGRKSKPFRYTDRGMMANIGRKKGIIELENGRNYKGFIPWISWLAVHLFFLAGFGNKLKTFATWAWIYTSRDMATPIILEKQDD